MLKSAKIINSLRKSTLLLLVTFLLFVGSTNKSFAKEASLNLQPYKIIKNSTIDESYIKKLLIVASIEPKESEFHGTYQKKIKNLSEIIRSHWDVEVTIIDVADYKRGYIKNFDALFLVEEYGRLVPYSLFRDLVHSKDKEIIWSGFGSEELVASLLNRFLYPQRSTAQFSSLVYKDEEFRSEDLNYLTDFEFPENSGKIEVLASLIDEKGEKTPLILNIGERFLVMPFETPFSYSIDDYSLVFLDVLHNSLGHHKREKKALVRLEDIDTYTYRRTGKLSDVYSYLKSKNIHFHLALIARYINPEKNLDLEIGDRFFFKQLLTKMVSEGQATLVQHGYTHQKGTGISAYDYEFWDDVRDGPLEYDSEEFVIARVKAAQEIMGKNGFPLPDIWETPHYALSDLDAKVINSYYPLRYENLQDLGRFPFSIQVDKSIYFPENLGYVNSEDDIARIEESLAQLSVFEDPVASFFWHPWREIGELKHLVASLTDGGYGFVSVYDLVEHVDEAEGFLALTAFRENKNLLLRYKITEFWMGTAFILFSYGGFLYVRNVLWIRRYFRRIKKHKLSIDQLKKLAKSKGKKLPNIAIFVPARMEAYVIENTIRRLVKLDYPKKNYRVFVIADERDIDEKPEKLTKDIVKKLSVKLNRECRCRLTHCLEVPRWYSGKFESYEKTYKNSTKGRALNWALQKVCNSREWKGIDMVGILDADGRFDTNVLKEVAYKRLKSGSKLLQGPVFQVSNFDKVSFIGVAAGLELAIHHMTKLAHRLNKEPGRPQFLAGTNYFVDKNLIVEVGGWDDDALVEDAELALRSYIKKGVVARWLSWPEVEQTPPNFSVYRRQRERWTRGHLDLIKDIKKAKIPLRDKIRFLSEIYINLFRVFIDLGVPVVGWTLMISGVLLDLGPLLRMFSLFLLIMSVFIWDFYGFMYRKLYGLNYIKNTNASAWSRSTKLFSFHPLIFLFSGYSSSTGYKFIQSIKLVLFIPLFIFAQSIPRITGSFKYLFKVGGGVWYKTERTKETLTE